MALETLQLHESAAVAAAAYDRARRTLRVTFKAEGGSDGRTYDYFRVPPHVVEDFVSAESHGQFVNWRIKPHYRFKEVV